MSVYINSSQCLRLHDITLHGWIINAIKLINLILKDICAVCSTTVRQQTFLYMNLRWQVYSGDKFLKMEVLGQNQFMSKYYQTLKISPINRS